jgi:hypothetical protein
MGVCRIAGSSGRQKGPGRLGDRLGVFHVQVMAPGQGQPDLAVYPP